MSPKLFKDRNHELPSMETQKDIDAVRVYIAKTRDPEKPYGIVLTDQHNRVLSVALGDKPRGMCVGESYVRSNWTSAELNPGDRFYLRPLPGMGFGEIDSEEMTVHDVRCIPLQSYDALKKEIVDREYPLEEYEWYLNTRKYGSVPHSGFGIGLERTVRWITGVHHIRETIPFPRMINYIRP